MEKILIPMAVLLFIILCKKLPIIGGKINVALIITGVLTLFISGMFNPADWIGAWVDGIDRLAWIIALSIVGSLFAEISVRLGTVDTIIGSLTAKFGKHPRLLIVGILFALVLAGSLLGDAIAAATVIGLLTIGLLSSMNMPGEKIAAIIVMGASIGSIMPPMTQALLLSSSLVGTDPDPVVNMGYITVSIVFVIIALYCSLFLVKKSNFPGANPAVEIKYSGQKAGDILRKNWKSLIPMMVLILIVLLRTLPIPYVAVDMGPTILDNVTVAVPEAGDPVSLFDWMSQVTILRGFTNGVVLSIICAIGVAFLFKKIRSNAKSVVTEGMSKVKKTVGLQLCCAFMLGAFYASGAIEEVAVFATGLDDNLLKIGGVVAMMIIGMLTGSQSTTQSVIFAFFGPALIATGMDATNAAVAGANLAAAGQGLPPADLTTFVVVGIVAAQFGRKVDPIKSMVYSVPMCICFLIIGLVFLYI